MRVKTCMGLERFEVDKTRAFSWISRKFRKSRKSWKWDLLKSEITEILEILEILEMGFSGEWVVLKIFG